MPPTTTPRNPGPSQPPQPRPYVLIGVAIGLIALIGVIGGAVILRGCAAHEVQASEMVAPPPPVVVIPAAAPAESLITPTDAPSEPPPVQSSSRRPARRKPAPVPFRGTIYPPLAAENPEPVEEVKAEAEDNGDAVEEPEKVEPEESEKPDTPICAPAETKPGEVRQGGKLRRFFGALGRPFRNKKAPEK